MSNELSLWENESQVLQIKEIYGKNLSMGEFTTLVQMGKATGLNPFLRELWAVKYGDNAAQIFIGRDGYRKSAQANANYDYHHVEAVYENDDLNYDLSKGEVIHKQNFKNRGNLLGAYCITKRKNSSKPIFVFVELKEYSTNKSLWASKPATMIKKVAEAQSLRMAFQDIFGGSYAEEEHSSEPLSQIQQKEINSTQQKLDQGTPISQTYSIDEDELLKHLDIVKNSSDLDLLKVNYTSAMKFAKGDKQALAFIVTTKDDRKKYLDECKDAIKSKLEQNNPVAEQSTADWQKDFSGEKNEKS